MLRWWVKHVFSRIFKPMARWYSSKDRAYRYKGIRIQVGAGVFHPGLFFSTGFLLEWIENQPIEGRKILELGAGSGLLSFVAARAGAVVTATDISPQVVRYLQQNQLSTGLPLNILHSDLFEQIPAQASFDLVVINPPYYPANPANESQQAWFCGSNFQYFKRLFEGLSNREFGQAVMVLSEDCEVETIRQIALNYGFILRLEAQKTILWETNLIYALDLAPQKA